MSTSGKVSRKRAGFFFLYLIGLKEAIYSEDPKMLYFRRSYPELPFQYFHRLKAR
jgi:hypothetical protein